jgi:hypothetical protein
VTAVAEAGGGGGGSSFLGTGAALESQGTNTGNGQVTINYDPSTDSCPTALVVAPKFTG